MVRTNVSTAASVHHFLILYVSPIIATMTQHMDPEDDYVMITDAEEHIKLKAAARQKAAEESRNILRGKWNIINIPLN